MNFLDLKTVSPKLERLSEMMFAKQQQQQHAIAVEAENSKYNNSYDDEMSDQLCEDEDELASAVQAAASACSNEKSKAVEMAENEEEELDEEDFQADGNLSDDKIDDHFDEAGDDFPSMKREMDENQLGFSSTPIKGEPGSALVTLTPPLTQSDLLCNVCNKQFDNLHRLQRHMMCHDMNPELRKFKCDYCSKAFKFKHHLKVNGS